MKFINNSAKDAIYRKLEELSQLIKRDTFDLTQDDHSGIEVQLEKLKEYINGKYLKNTPSQD